MVLRAPILTDEFGVDAGGNDVYTGTKFTGVKNQTLNCDDWINTAAPFAGLGRRNVSTLNWTEGFVRPCGVAGRRYCFQD